MGDLVLTARIEERNERHARISVWQNDGKAGTLTVEAEYAAEVLERLLGHEKATADEIQAARNEYQTDDVQIDDNARVSRLDTGGYFVEAWVWLPPNEE